MPTTASLRLPSGALATLELDPFAAGALVLAVNGVTQSHVSAADPTLLFFDYMRRMGNIVDAAATPREPLTVVHLGGGGLSLPRYVAATRPGSRQFVVEAEVGLIEFVLHAAPLSAGASVEFVIADALAGLRSLAPRLAGAASIIVCDVYAGLSTPAHLSTAGFFAEVKELALAPDGIIVVNVADESGLDLTQDPSSAFGDPLVRRRDGAIAYQLAVVVDDAAAGVTRVVRGCDIAPSTATQVALQRLLGLPTPAYRHHLLLLEQRGHKLAKLHGAVGASQLRAVYSGPQLCGWLAWCAELTPRAEPCTPAQLLTSFAWERVRRADRLVRWTGERLELDNDRGDERAND